MAKKVSLVLMTYNSSANLEKTLHSIENQDYPNIEVCIQDSCSTDTTIDIIKNYASSSHNSVIWRSEKDTGIYDGLNRSIKMATGDYILVMNDEFTCDDALTKLVTTLEREEASFPTDSNKRIVGVHSDLVYADNGKIIRYWHMGRGTIWSGWCPAHPTMLIKREIYEKYGLYDTSYVSASDYEYMVRFLKDKENVLAYVPEVLVSMFVGGTSNEGVYNYWRSITESLRGIHANGIYCGLWMTFLRTVRVAMQFLRKR